MVQLADLAGGQADLVAVAGIAGGGGGHDLALGQLALHRLGHRLQRVARAGHAHGLVDVAAAGQRVADGAADAGGRAAERLDLGGVVVGLVLEQKQPVLLFAVHVALDLDGAGVDLLALVEVFQDAPLFQGFGADGGGVHQGAGLFVAAGLAAQRHITVKRRLHDLVVDGHAVQNGAEGGVAAVVGPVGVDHADLGDGGVAALALKVILAEHDVGVVHGQALLVAERLQRILVHLDKAGQRFHLAGDGKFHLQRLALVQAGLAGFHRVDEVLFDGGQILSSQVALQQVDLGAAHVGALALAQQLDALGSRVRPLVKLAGQILDGKDRFCFGQGGVGHVHRRLAEHGGDGAVEQLFVDALHVVAVQKAQAGQAFDAQQFGQLVQQALGLAVKAGFLFHINAIYHIIPSLSVRPGRVRRCRCAGAVCQNGRCRRPRRLFPARRAGRRRWRSRPARGRRR